MAKGNYKHGESNPRTPEYRAWKCMRDRCNTPSNLKYDRYGGRGITICKKWEDYSVFLKDMGRKPSPAHSIDREDNDKSYSKSNCRWVTVKQQACNKALSRYVIVGSQTLPLIEACVLKGVNYKTILSRIYAQGVTSQVAFDRS